MKKKIIDSLICIGMLLTTFFSVCIPSGIAAPPEMPSHPIPASGSSGVTIFIKLEWQSNDPGLTYDVYFGTESPPPLVATNHTGTSYRPTIRLLLNTTYYWQLIAYNSDQETNESPIWSFTTAGDQPPFQPVVLDGPTVAGPQIDLEFKTVAPDPEGDEVYYQWDWGDGNYSEWLGPYAFGEQVETTHQWADNGTYDIRVRARDVLGELGDWSFIYQIAISPQIQFVNLAPGHLYFNFFGFDKTYGYIHALDLLNLALVISTIGYGINLNATSTDAVHSVIFEIASRIFEEDRWNTTADNLSGNFFEGNFIINNGLYYTTATAYDSEGRLIDRVSRQYVAFYTWQFNMIKQILGNQ